MPDPIDDCPGSRWILYPLPKKVTLKSVSLYSVSDLTLRLEKYGLEDVGRNLPSLELYGSFW